jgi:hypothetical protein
VSTVRWVTTVTNTGEITRIIGLFTRRSRAGFATGGDRDNHETYSSPKSSSRSKTSFTPPSSC